MLKWNSYVSTLNARGYLKSAKKQEYMVGYGGC
jgi:hypothetical protein